MKLTTSWGELAALDEGTGEPVLLLHSLAQRGELWRPLIDRMAPHARVLAMDARGHGDSTWDETPFSVQDLAEDAARLITELDAGPAAVAGMSMGGCVAIALAATHPELVRSLVLADTTACYGPDRREQWEQRAQVALAKPRREQTTFQLDRWFSPEFVASDPAEVARVVEIFVRTDSRAHAQACRALGDFDGTALLASIACPTLVVVGEHDYATPPDMARTLADGIPDAELRVFTEARHFSVLEKPDAKDLVVSHLLGKEA
ncbi:alpha/beta hydrolase [Saccharopolyspora sp. K220]|uniref:alpha/beta fold hydrolase n=1 Tax=Saccharopolyspora soli TaxID=2926618 RepID=UPI001F562822|nr:alpha/beta fold hydrolase [Saccharopolyspora soli]MCI2415890.1 alpha/beta hydrolase [Saccharopolyspora soli]